MLSHTALGYRGRNVIMYIPQSFPPQCCFGHLRIVGWGLSTNSYSSWDVMKKNEHVTKRLFMEDQLYNMTRAYSTGHPLRRKKENRDEDETIKVEEGKEKEVSEGTEHKPATPSPEISTAVPAASQTDIRQSPPTSASSDINSHSLQAPLLDINEPPPPSTPSDTRKPVSSPDTIIAPDIKPVTKAAVGSDQLPSRFLRYIVGRYTWYLGRFQESLRNEMPDTFNMFRIFTVGLKEFIIDFK